MGFSGNLGGTSLIGIGRIRYEAFLFILSMVVLGHHGGGEEGSGVSGKYCGRIGFVNVDC